MMQRSGILSQGFIRAAVKQNTLFLQLCQLVLFYKYLIANSQAPLYRYSLD